MKKTASKNSAKKTSVKRSQPKLNDQYMVKVQHLPIIVALVTVIIAAIYVIISMIGILNPRIRTVC